MKLGDRIREARKAKGWTIAELAKDTGYTSHSIGEVERNLWIPSDRFLRAIEKALKTKLRK